jgi:hypothetical protein
VDSSFRIPDTTGPEIVVRRTLLGDIKVFADGVPLKKLSWRRLAYTVPLPDGTTTELRLTGQWSGLRASVNGADLPLEPRLPRWVVVLSFLPFVLIIGGLIGALFAIGGLAVNTALARRAIRAPIKAAAMLAVTALAIGLYFGTIVAIAPVPSLTAGTCVNGIHEGATVTAATTRAVSCASAHENEVIGNLTHPGSGSYPGMTVLLDYGQNPCLDAFRAYVGVDFEVSSLMMIEVVPTDVTWLKGDRLISCVVLPSDGTKLTGSVKGTAR